MRSTKNGVLGEGVDFCQDLSPVTKCIVDNLGSLMMMNRKLCDKKYVACDTELKDNKLCLLQIYAKGEPVYLVRTNYPVLQCDFAKHIIKIFMENIGTVKVFHDARNDIPAIYRYCKAYTRPVFDTQAAAEFLRLGKQMGYIDLVNKILNLQLEKDKTISRSDWSRRKLTIEQLMYAVKDVYFLAYMYERVKYMLENCAMNINPIEYIDRPKGKSERYNKALSLVEAMKIEMNEYREPDFVTKRPGLGKLKLSRHPWRNLERKQDYFCYRPGTEPVWPALRFEVLQSGVFIVGNPKVGGGDEKSDSSNDSKSDRSKLESGNMKEHDGVQQS